MCVCIYVCVLYAYTCVCERETERERERERERETGGETEKEREERFGGLVRPKSAGQANRLNRLKIQEKVDVVISSPKAVWRQCLFLLSI